MEVSTYCSPSIDVRLVKFLNNSWPEDKYTLLLPPMVISYLLLESVSVTHAKTPPSLSLLTSKQSVPFAVCPLIVSVNVIFSISCFAIFVLKKLVVASPVIPAIK